MHFLEREVNHGSIRSTGSSLRVAGFVVEGYSCWVPAQWQGPLRQVNLRREGNGAPAQKMVRLCLSNKSLAKQLIADHWEVKPEIATRPCPVDGTQETNTARKFFLYLLGDYQNLNM
jgi:hypothetical protein